MKILRWGRAPKIFYARKGGAEKIVLPRRGGVKGGGGLRKFVYFKPIHDTIIQVGGFSTEQFNYSAISRGLQI